MGGCNPNASPRSSTPSTGSTGIPAACRECPDPDDWTIDGHAFDGDPRMSSAIALRTLGACAGCPVRIPCLVEGLTAIRVELAVDQDRTPESARTLSSRSRR